MIRDQDKGLSGLVGPGGVNVRQTEVLPCARKQRDAWDSLRKIGDSGGEWQ